MGSPEPAARAHVGRPSQNCSSRCSSCCPSHWHRVRLWLDNSGSPGSGCVWLAQWPRLRYPRCPDQRRFPYTRHSPVPCCLLPVPRAFWQAAFLPGGFFRPLPAPPLLVAPVRQLNRQVATMLCARSCLRQPHFRLPRILFQPSADLFRQRPDCAALRKNPLPARMLQRLGQPWKAAGREPGPRAGRLFCLRKNGKGEIFVFSWDTYINLSTSIQELAANN